MLGYDNSAIRNSKVLRCRVVGRMVVELIEYGEVMGETRGYSDGTRY